MTIESLRVQYSEYSDRANRLEKTLLSELPKLLSRDQVTLGVPMESRVKTWDSIEEKIKRNQLSLESIDDLDDLIGVRLILLFRSDLAKVEQLIVDTFEVLSSKDTSESLSEMQFGYQSQHYAIKLPKEWLLLPTMTDLGGLKIELQVRTLAQHIWAAASHKLQYKREDGVPLPIRRSIHRVSALLETVDLEFARILVERDDYVKHGIPEAESNEPLNVDLLASLLNDVYPESNKDDGEIYANLLTNLKKLSVGTIEKLKPILIKHYRATMEEELSYVNMYSGRDFTDDFGDEILDAEDIDRRSRGVFFSHVGLARESLRLEFGKELVEKIILA